MVERFPSKLRGITGAGLMIGIRCEINNGDLITELTKNRLLTVKAGDNSIRLLPPLNVQQNEIDEALTILASVLENWQT